MKNKQSILAIAVSATLTYGMDTQAAPLPEGTLLTIEMGDGVLSSICNVGSCFTMETATTFLFWANYEGGIDGGFVVGKNQASGGQENEPINATTDTPGDLTNAWSFFNNWGTFFADNAQNVFSDTSNDGTTVINDLNWAWNGATAPLGGGTVNDYTVTLDQSGNGTWSLDYSQVVPEGDFAGAHFRTVIRGGVIAPPACKLNFPIKQVTTTGGGQGQSVNATVQTTFTGYITTEAGLTSGGKNAVKICSGTTVDYETISSVGTATCRINGVAVANTGSVSIGDKLICTNKPDGSDTDRFSIKRGG